MDYFSSVSLRGLEPSDLTDKKDELVGWWLKRFDVMVLDPTLWETQKYSTTRTNKNNNNLLYLYVVYN